MVADSFPPTFITRSCSHCHSVGRPSAQAFSLVAANKITTAEDTYDRGLWIEQRRYGHQDCGDGPSNRGKGRYRRGPTTKSGSWSHSQSIATREKVVSGQWPNKPQDGQTEAGCCYAPCLQASASTSQRSFETAPWRHSCWASEKTMRGKEGGVSSEVKEAELRYREWRTWSKSRPCPCNLHFCRPPSRRWIGPQHTARIANIPHSIFASST